MALGHGLQDAQKTMGVIFLVADHERYLAPDTTELPLWVIASSAGAISLGTYSGGWRIMRTLGRKIIHLDPPHAFAAESVGATVLYVSAFVYQAPVSTTHVITSAIMGSGATRRFSAVRWGMARSIVDRLGPHLPRRRARRRPLLRGPQPPPQLSRLWTLG